MSKFEILCVTMNQKDFSKIKEMNIKSDVVFANQADRTEYEEISFDGHTAKMITTETRGVGKNRNFALMYASSDICLLADDDCKYSDDMEEKILGEFSRHPDADVMIFYLEDDQDRGQKSYKKTKKCLPFGRTPWACFRVAFRLSSVKKANINFTTLFGGGCKFPSGEDSMFIKDARKKGLTMYVSKETIGTVSFAESTWFTGYDQKYFFGVGAYYTAIKDNLILKFLYTLLRTRNKGDLSVRERLFWLKNGKKGYDEYLSYAEFKEKYSL